MLEANCNESFAKQTYHKAVKESLVLGQIVQISNANTIKPTARSIEPGAYLATPTSRPRIGVVTSGSLAHEPSVSVKISGEVTVKLGDAVDYSTAPANTVYALNVLPNGLGASAGGLLVRKAANTINYAAADVFKNCNGKFVRLFV